MAKVYLFRKLSELNKQQSDVSSEAISSVLDKVLKGKTSTIFNYGEWPDYGAAGYQCDKLDMMGRVLSDLFSHVYTMEISLEINISIRHVLLNDKHNQSAMKPADGECVKQPKEHFVACPNDVFKYMEKAIKRLQLSDQGDSLSAYAYLLFSICVRQTNLEQSINLKGELQLMHLKDVLHPELMPLQTTPLGALVKIISELSNKQKTHLRHNNIRLTRILKEVLNTDEPTVIINFTTMPQIELDGVSATGCAKIWKALYMRERNKCKSLTEKLLCLELRHGSGHRLKLDELVTIVRKRNSKSQLELGDKARKTQALEIEQTCTPLPQRQMSLARENQLAEEQSKLNDEINEIKSHAEGTLEEILQLQQIVAELTTKFQQQTQTLEQKDRVLDRLHALLAKANSKVQQQRTKFHRKLGMYSDLFKNLWRQQSTSLRIQEQQREEQLSKMFDTFCNEMHSAHQTQLQLAPKNCSELRGKPAMGNVRHGVASQRTRR